MSADPIPGTWARACNGAMYYVLAVAEMEATGEHVVVYRARCGRVWVRPVTEWSQEVAPSLRRFEVTLAPSRRLPDWA